MSITIVKYRTWIFIGEGSLHSGVFMPGFWCVRVGKFAVGVNGVFVEMVPVLVYIN